MKIYVDWENCIIITEKEREEVDISEEIADYFNTADLWEYVCKNGVESARELILDRYFEEFEFND